MELHGAGFNIPCGSLLSQDIKWFYVCHLCTPNKDSAWGSMLGSAGCPSEILNGLGNHWVGEIGRGLIDRAVLMTGRHISSSSRRLKKSTSLILLSPFSFDQGSLSFWKRITKKCSKTCPYHNFSLGLATYTSFCCQTFLCNLHACPGPRLARP